MSNIGSYTTRSFSESQKFLVLDPSTGTTSLVLGSDLVSHITPSLNSVQAETTRLAAENTDYDVGTVIQTTGATSIDDGQAGLFLVVEGGEGDFPMLNGNDLLVIGGDAFLREQLISSATGDGSDLVAHTGTTDSVTDALNKRVIYIATFAELELYDTAGLSDGQQFSVSDAGIYTYDLATETFVKASYTAAGGAALVGLSEGGTVEDSIDYVTPEMLGAVGDGVTDDKAAFDLAIATGKPVKLQYGKTYLCSPLASSAAISLYCTGRYGATIKLKDASDDHLITATGTFFSSGVKFDGNKAGQTDRLKSIVSATGTSVVSWDSHFTESLFAGIHVENAPLTYLGLKGCTFDAMAEATGVQGEQTQAVNCRVSGTGAVVDVTGCQFLADTPSDIDAAPGGMIFDVVTAATDSYSKANIEGNYFKNIGQRKSFGTGNHYIGSVDFYTNVDNSVVSGNIVDTYYYVPLKLQNSNKVICSGNIINGQADTTAGQAIVFQNARDRQAAIRDLTCSGNVITLSGRTNDGIYVQGDPDGVYSTDRVVIEGNTIYGAQYCVNTSYVQRAVVNGNNLELCVYGVYARDIPAAGQVKYSVTGGHIINANSRGVYVNGNSANECRLSVVGVTFEDSVAFSIDTNWVKDAVITGCQFDNTDNGALVDDIRIQNGTMAVVTGCSNGTITANVTMAVGTLKQAGNSWS